MRYGICTGSNNLTTAHAAGYDFVELTMGELLPEQSDMAFAPVCAKLSASPIPIEVCNCFIPSTLKLVGPSVDLLSVSAYMQTALRRAAQVGVAIVGFGSGGARQRPKGFSRDIARSQFSVAARLAAEIGASHGIIIAIEPLCPAICNLINSEQEGAQLVEEIGHQHLQLLADIYHMLRQREPFSILHTVARHLVHVHLDSFHFPFPAKSGDDDVSAFFSALSGAGYQGRISLEDNCGNMVSGENDPLLVENFSRQLSAMKQHWEHVTLSNSNYQKGWR